jgi:D-sedoheptulose 7-phosphate isomerase
MFEKILENSIQEAIRAITLLDTHSCKLFLSKAATLLVNCLREGGKIFSAGNGGSLADSLHFAEELTGKFRNERRPLPAIALADPAHITCVANDYGFEYVFSRSLEALGQPGDIFLALSTSGNSPNILKALETAKKKGITSIGFLGKGGGEAKKFCDFFYSVDGFSYSDRIQEVHMTMLHILIELIEAKLRDDSLQEEIRDSLSTN